MRDEGYEVLEALDGVQAVALLTDLPRPIVLLVTDFMPGGLDGAQLASRFRALNPDVPVVIATGRLDVMQRSGFQPCDVSTGIIPLGFFRDRSEQASRSRSPAPPGLALVAAPDWRALSQELAMTLTETQQTILTQAACRSDGLAVAPTHLQPGPRAAMAKALLAAGLVIRVEGTDAEPDAGRKLDGQVTFLRIADAGRQAIGADEPPVNAERQLPGAIVRRGDQEHDLRTFRDHYEAAQTDHCGIAATERYQRLPAVRRTSPRASCSTKRLGFPKPPGQRCRNLRH